MDIATGLIPMGVMGGMGGMGEVILGDMVAGTAGMEGTDRAMGQTS